MTRISSLWLTESNEDAPINMWGLPRGTNAIRPEDAQAVQRARLFYAMTRCVARKGYAATSVADVLAIARVSRRTFYQLFGDKEQCYLALFQKAHDTLVQEVLGVQHEGMTWVERLRCSHRAYLDFFVKNPGLSQTLLVEVVAAGPKALAMRDRFYERFTRFQHNLYEMRREEKADLPALPVEVFAILISGIESLIAQWTRSGRAKDLMLLEPVLLHVVGAVHGASIDQPRS